MNAHTEAEEELTLAKRLRQVSFGGHGSRDDWSEDPEKSGPRYYDAYLNGGLNTDGIAAQAAQHFLMYEAIEGAAERHRDSLGEDFAFWMPELHRLPSLRADLEHWLGANWEAEVRGRFATPGIQAYVARINEVALNSVPMFVAHHYTRYLADLSGGQMIARMFAESYGIEDGKGMQFYRFEEIEDANEFKDRYRALLNSAGFTEVEQEQIAEEVALAYRLNSEAGADLEARAAEYLAAETANN